MGKAARWFRGFLGLKKPPPPPPSVAAKPKKRWGFARSFKCAVPPPAHGGEHQAIAAAENTVRAAHFSEEWAAVVIQAHFRSYLARRALRALKSLVKLQALVRGHILRKETTEILRRMQALSRAQARARASRAQLSESPSSSAKSSQFCHPGPATPEKFEHVIRSNSARRDLSPILKRNGSKTTSRMINDSDKQQNDWHCSEHINGHLAKNSFVGNEKTEKIVEIDTAKSHLMAKRKNLFHPTHLGLYSDQYSHSFSTSKDSTTRQSLPSPSSYEVRSFSPSKAAQDLDESPFCTAHNSPQLCSASSRGGSSRKSPFTPAKSDGSKSYLNEYSDHPNYMAYTESSKAKVRSLSAPKQRPQIEKSGSIKRSLVYNHGESKVCAQRASAMHASFVNKAYPGSGRLDRLGLPVVYGGYLYRY